MTPICRIAAAAAALCLLPTVGIAQHHNPQQTQVNFQYHEVIPAGADSTPVFLKVFDRIRQDCELVGKAFSRRCVITQININLNANSGDMAGLRNLNANATMILPPEPVEVPPPSAPAPPPAAAPTR